jgi:hypothetical protein
MGRTNRASPLTQVFVQETPLGEISTHRTHSHTFRKKSWDRERTPGGLAVLTGCPDPPHTPVSVDHRAGSPRGSERTEGRPRPRFLTKRRRRRKKGQTGCSLSCKRAAHAPAAERRYWHNDSRLETRPAGPPRLGRRRRRRRRGRRRRGSDSRLVARGGLCVLSTPWRCGCFLLRENTQGTAPHRTAPRSPTFTVRRRPRRAPRGMDAARRGGRPATRAASDAGVRATR